MSELPERADVVVIGAGVVGASVAWHLAAMGASDVVLLERSKIGSGTTWHAAGNMETWRADPLIGAMVAYTVELFPELERQSGIQIGWRQDGRIHFTADPAVFAKYRHVPARARARGVDVHLLTPAEIGQKLPVIALDGILGGLWTPNDGRVDPTNLATAYARGAMLRGVRLVEDQPVTRIVAENGRVVGVETASGRIACEQVVLAGGLWSTALAATCGVRLPLMALHHFYLLTEACGIPRDLPLFLSYDEAVYGREDVGGLLIGPFDRNAIPVEAHELPGAFSFALLDENWDQIAPNMEVLGRRFPLLATTGIRTLVNGPESFTPDGNMLLGEAPGLRGLHLACGMNSNGIALAAGVGRLTAERLVGRAPSWDATRLDPRRFEPFQATDAYRRARMSEVPAWFCDHDDSKSAVRGLRRSPLHARHVEAGAAFEHVAGFERPMHFGSPAAELDAALTAAVRIDHSADAKLLLAGTDADAVLARLGGEGVDRTLLGPNGRPAARACVVPLGEIGTLLIAEAGTGGFLQSAVAAAIRPGEHAVALDATSYWALIDVAGPEVTATLPDLADPAIAAPVIDLVPCIAIRLGERHWRLAMPSDMACRVDEALAAAGLRPAGEQVATTLRVLTGKPAWAAEISPVHDGATGSMRRVRGTVEAAAVEPLEPVLSGDRTVGWITSAGLPVAGAVPVMALVEAGAADLATLVEGRTVPIRPV